MTDNGTLLSIENLSTHFFIEDGAAKAVQDSKLYNGQELENWSLEVCKKLRDEHPDEGFSGISPRL